MDKISRLYKKTTKPTKILGCKNISLYGNLCCLQLMVGKDVAKFLGYQSMQEAVVSLREKVKERLVLENHFLL